MNQFRNQSKIVFQSTTVFENENAFYLLTHSNDKFVYKSKSETIELFVTIVVERCSSMSI